MASIPLLMALGQGFASAHDELKNYYDLKREEEERRQQRLLQGLFTEEEVPAAPPVTYDPNNPQTLAHAVATAQGNGSGFRDPANMPPRKTGGIPGPDPQLAGSLDPKQFALRTMTAPYVETPEVRAPRHPSYTQLGTTNLYVNPRKSLSFMVASEAAKDQAEAQRALEKYRHELNLQAIEHEDRLRRAAALEAETRASDLARRAGAGALSIAGIKVPEGADTTLAPDLLDYFGDLESARISGSLRFGAGRMPDIEIGAQLLRRQQERIARRNQLFGNQQVMLQLHMEAQQNKVPPDQVSAYVNRRIQEMVDAEIPWTPEMDELLQQYMQYQQMLIRQQMGGALTPPPKTKSSAAPEPEPGPLPSDAAMTLLPPSSRFNFGTLSTPQNMLGMAGGVAPLRDDVRQVIDDAIRAQKSRDEIMEAVQSDDVLRPYALGIDAYLTQKGVR